MCWNYIVIFEMLFFCYRIAPSNDVLSVRNLLNSYKKYSESSEAWDLNEDRIRELHVTIRIPFFRGIDIVLPLSYTKIFSLICPHTLYNASTRHFKEPKDWLRKRMCQLKPNVEEVIIAILD
jgi:hypothetical protein